MFSWYMGLENQQYIVNSMVPLRWYLYSSEKRQIQSIYTFLVKLDKDEPTMARLVTLPLKTDWTELMKLDFPEPTGPRRRTRAWVTSL